MPDPIDFARVKTQTDRAIVADLLEEDNRREEAWLLRSGLPVVYVGGKVELCQCRDRNTAWDGVCDACLAAYEEEAARVYDALADAEMKRQQEEYLRDCRPCPHCGGTEHQGVCLSLACVEGRLRAAWLPLIRADAWRYESHTDDDDMEGNCPGHEWTLMVDCVCGYDEDGAEFSVLALRTCGRCGLIEGQRLYSGQTEPAGYVEGKGWRLG